MKNLQIFSEEKLILGLSILMHTLPKPIQAHLQACDADMTECFPCALIEDYMFEVQLPRVAKHLGETS